MIVSGALRVFTGYGDAVVNPNFDITIQNMFAWIERVKPLFAIVLM